MPKKIVISLIVLVALATVVTAALSGNLSVPGQQTYSTATVEGRIIGKAFTEGKVAGSVTGIFFAPTNHPEAKGLPADIKTDGAYSIRLTNGINYTVYMYVIDPNNDEDSGICQGQEAFLDNLHQASYVLDITPVNCA